MEVRPAVADLRARAMIVVPWCGLTYGWHTVRGAGRVTGQMLRWWHAPACGSWSRRLWRPGHHEALAAHREGKRTGSARGRILAACALLVLAALVAMAALSPWWGWLILGLVLVLALARHGRPEGRQVIRPAVVPTAYATPTPEIITRALGSLSLAAIDAAIRDGRVSHSSVTCTARGRAGPRNWDLPRGVTAWEVIARRDKLHSGLRRPLSATWPEAVPHEHEGRLRLWIGYQAMAKARPATWPLQRARQGRHLRRCPVRH
jgi:DNA segregation ATPase FtsK/SpoIIIE, S-DNA-T family